MFFGLAMVFYLLFVLVFDADTPVYRLFFFPLFFVFWKLKPKIDNYFSQMDKSQAWRRGLLILAVLAIVARGLNIHHRFAKPIGFMEDIAYLNRDAVKTLFYEQKDPYHERLNDYWIQHKGETKNYMGYKYPPFQIFYYAPFVHFWDLKGIYAGNLIIFILAAFFIFKILRGISLVHGLIGLILYLATDYYFVLCFHHGTNDFVSSFLALLSLYLIQKRQNNTAGVMMGLSLLSKQLPAGLICILLLAQKKFRPLIIAGVIFLIGCLPFILWHPQSFYENMVEFALHRPARPTSMIYGWPHWLQMATQLVGFITVIGLALWGNVKKDLNFENGWLMALLGVCIFLITAKMSPPHYFVWLTCYSILFFMIPFKQKNNAS